MRKLSILLMVLAVNVCSFAGVSDRTVHAEWSSWTFRTFAGDGYLADTWNASDVSALTLSDAPNAYVYENAVYASNYEGRDGVLMLTGLGYRNMDFFMPNYNGGEYKEITVQITYQAIGYAPVLGADAYINDVLLVSGVYGPYSLDQQTLENNWVTATYQFIITPNCDYEYITLGFEYSGSQAIALDSMVIDTLCVPEPATMVLLTLGTVILFRKRK